MYSLYERRKKNQWEMLSCWKNTKSFEDKMNAIFLNKLRVEVNENKSLVSLTQIDWYY